MSHPSTSPSAFTEAVAAFRRGEFAQARAMAQGLADKEPGRPVVWELLAASEEQLGRLREAAATLDRGIAANPNAANLQNLAGAIWTRLDDPQRAMTHFRRAIAIQPGFAMAWLNLGRLSAVNGARRDAEEAFRAAMRAEPENPIFATELAILLAEGGDPTAAERQTEDADRKTRTFFATPRPQEVQAQMAGLRLRAAKAIADAFVNTGASLKALGHLEDAIRLGAGPETQSTFLAMLRGVRFTSPRATLKPILQRALAEHWAPAIELSAICAQILLLQPEFQAVSKRLSDDTPLAETEIQTGSFRHVFSDALFLAYLDKVLVAEPAMENLLRNLRRALASYVAKAALDVPSAHLCVALANQFFVGEYVAGTQEGESEIEEQLRTKCREALARNEQPPPSAVAMLCAYRPLMQALPKEEISKLTRVDALRPLFARQWDAPHEEIRLRADIPALTQVRTGVSQAVQEQYEDHPFPIWIDPPGRAKRIRPSEWLAQCFPAASAPPLEEGEQYRTLVAGCGTGHEIAALNLTLADIQILAVDLSLTSLAFAKRKSAELGHRNVTYAQADVLELGGLDRRFDIIFSAGVLHHLADPLAGWATLRDLLKPNGVMYVALYSKLARRAVTAARHFVAINGYGATTEEIRRFRRDIAGMSEETAPEWRRDLMNRIDFYSVSMLRDLLFHVQETTYTIDEIEQAIRALGLEFRGFDVDAGVQKKFSARFGTRVEAAALLENWKTFEAENSSVFSGMYHFLVQKR